MQKEKLMHKFLYLLLINLSLIRDSCVTRQSKGSHTFHSLSNRVSHKNSGSQAIEKELPGRSIFSLRSTISSDNYNSQLSFPFQAKEIASLIYKYVNEVSTEMNRPHEGLAGVLRSQDLKL